MRQRSIVTITGFAGAKPYPERNLLMEATLTAIEVTGTIDADRHLHRDNALPVSGSRRVRVIVLYPPEELSETE
jgi:hypothetical protein